VETVFDSLAFLEQIVVGLYGYWLFQTHSEYWCLGGMFSDLIWRIVKLAFSQVVQHLGLHTFRAFSLVLRVNGFVPGCMDTLV
jgi:hypothetical protein